MFKKTLTITILVLLGCVLPGLVIIPAQYFGVDLSELQGADFKVTVGTVVTVLIFSAASVAFVYLVQRYLHRRPFMDLGFKREWVGDLAWGHLVGAVLAGLPIGLGLGLTESIQLDQLQLVNQVPASVGVPTLAGYYLFFIFMLTINSFKEELLFRSYPIENMAGESSANWAVILIASVIFSAVHLVLEPFTWVAFISRFLFGVFTCQVYVVTRSLWPIVGIHNGSNWLSVTFTGNWKMGGLLSVTTGADNVPVDLSPSYSIVSRGLAVVLMCVWMLRRSGQDADQVAS